MASDTEGRSMKTSITAIEKASWSTPLVIHGNLQQAIACASQWGYDGIELHLMDSDVLDKKEIVSALSAHNIILTSIGTGPSYSQQKIFMTSPCPDRRKEAIRRMMGHIRFGAETGAVVIIGLMKGQKKDCTDAQCYMGYFNDGMEACIREAERLGVNLVFEVIDRFESDWLNTVSEGLELLQYLGSDNLMLHLDTFHMNIEEPDCAESIRRAGRKVGHIHIADSDRWYPGHAHYDFAATFRALHEIEYGGAVALESFQYPDAKTAARLSLEFIRPLLEREGMNNTKGMRK